jgi:hypothetical protein
MAGRLEVIHCDCTEPRQVCRILFVPVLNVSLFRSHFPFSQGALPYACCVFGTLRHADQHHAMQGHIIRARHALRLMQPHGLHCIQVALGYPAGTFGCQKQLRRWTITTTDSMLAWGSGSASLGTSLLSSSLLGKAARPKVANGDKQSGRNTLPSADLRSN